MNKTLAEEELDRELVLKHTQHEFKKGSIYNDQVTAKVGPKSLVITSKAHRKEEISFKKVRRHGDDALEITLKRPQTKTQKCSLGHDHVVEETYCDYTWVTIPWDNVDGLVEWFNHGGWTAVSGKLDPKKKLLREAYDLLGELAKRDEILKPACQKMRAKISQEMDFHIRDLRAEAAE